jgi:hypothetical protein
MTATVFNNYTSIDRVTTSDSRLTDSRTPTTHSNTSHSETYITAAGVPVEKDTTAVTGILKGNGSVISTATAGTDYQAVLYKIYKVSGSDFTSSLNSAVTVTGLSWSIAANEEQNFDCILNTTNTATSLFRFGVNGPASPTAVAVTYSYRSTAYGTEVVNAAGAFTATVTTAAVTSSVLTTPLPFHIRGIVKNGSNAGTIAINATASTNGQTGTVRTGSMCRVW